MLLKLLCALPMSEACALAQVDMRKDGWRWN
jgi:hypothetical protein